MLSGEGNAGERWKTTIGLISKKGTLHVQHTLFCTFLCRCFARLQRETSRNFLVTHFVDWNVVRFLVHFFFTAAHFHLTLVAASISHFVTTAAKLSCCSLALDLCRPLSRWASLACRPLSLFLCFSLALYSKFVDMTINLSLILYKTRIQKKFQLSVFVFIDSLQGRI